MYENLWPDELKILVIDDDQEFLNFIRITLEQAGFRLIRSSKPEEGLSLAMQELPDLLLLDLMMPHLDGLELLRRLRRHPKLKNMPVIVVSARINTLDQERMLQAANPDYNSIDAYLTKPFPPGALLQTVKDVLVKHKDYIFEKNKPQEKPWQKYYKLGQTS
jgi:DNA-binding response OmpR family regulator